MTYDLDFRYARALQPEGLSILATAVQAVEDAIKDARKAGLDPEHDPGVILLARHLGRLASPCDGTDVRPGDAALKRQCLERIAQLQARPAIIALVLRGVDYDPDARIAFRREASRALRQIAYELGIPREQCAVQCFPDRGGPPGDVTLGSDQLHLRITARALRSGREISYRRARSRNDEFGGPVHHGDIGCLSDIPRFALRIARDLALEGNCDQARLFAGD